MATAKKTSEKIAEFEADQISKVLNKTSLTVLNKIINIYNETPHNKSFSNARALIISLSQHTLNSAEHTHSVINLS